MIETNVSSLVFLHLMSLCSYVSDRNEKEYLKSTLSYTRSWFEEVNGPGIFPGKIDKTSRAITGLKKNPFPFSPLKNGHSTSK